MAPDPGQAIRAHALGLGFDAVGFAPAHLGPESRARLTEFLAAGQHGDMGWLADRTAQRSHPQSLWPEARNVVALGLCYAPGFDALETLDRPDRGNISVYAATATITTCCAASSSILPNSWSPVSAAR